MNTPFAIIRIDDLLTRPGVYEVLSRFVHLPDGGRGAETFQIEVEADGTCHQLTLHGVRDGVLSREGWPVDRLHARPLIEGSLEETRAVIAKAARSTA